MKRSAFAGSFASLQAAKGAKTHGVTKAAFAPVADADSLALQGVAKSRHPEFEQVTIYIRKSTHKAARRKAEDERVGDFSDLAEKLFAEYVAC